MEDDGTPEHHRLLIPHDRAAFASLICHAAPHKAGQSHSFIYRRVK